MAIFFSPNALLSMRASGYKNTQYAIAELIDNSFDASADTVKVIFFEKRHNNRKYIDEILVCDDGTGMDLEALQVCLQFGFTGNDDLDLIVRNRKKGKFGFGLPNASISQAPNVRVYSWQSEGDFHTTFLSLDEVKNENSIEIPDVERAVLPGHYLEAGAVLNESHGAIVSWSCCDRLSNKSAVTIVDKGEVLIGRIYRYLIDSGKRIIMEIWEENPGRGNFVRTRSTIVAPNDPLFLMENTYVARILFGATQKRIEVVDKAYDPATYYSMHVTSETQCKPTNRKLNDHCHTYRFLWRGKEYLFEITTSVVENDIQNPGIREGGRTQVGAFYGGDKDPDRKQISFVRADREICSGNFGFYRETEARNRWWAIEVKFDASADDLLGVSNNKQGVEFWQTSGVDLHEEWDSNTATLQQAREHLWIKLTHHLENARKAAFKHVAEQGKRWELQHVKESGTQGDTAIPSGTDETTKAIKTTDGDRPLFSKEETEELYKRLKEKFPEVAADDIASAIHNFNESKVRGCVLYCPSENPSLWSFTNVRGFLISLVNTNHQFYTRILHPFRNRSFKAALSAIELFISSLAFEESNQIAARDSHRAVLEDYRSLVGIHLNRYLDENKIQVSESDLERLAVGSDDEID